MGQATGDGDIEPSNPIFQVIKPIDLLRLCLAFQLSLTCKRCFDTAVNQFPSFLADQNCAAIRPGLQPSRHIDRIAKRGELDIRAGPHLADYNWAGIDANPQDRVRPMNGFNFTGNAPNLFLDRERRLASAKWRVLQPSWRSEQSHHAVARVSLDFPALLVHCASNGLQDGVH